MKCFICGSEVNGERGRATVPGEFLYRYQAHHWLYREADTDEIHRCRLRPRVQVNYTPPLELPEIIEDPPPRYPPRTEVRGGIEI